MRRVADEVACARRATGAAVATVAALMFRYISTSDFLFLRNAYFLGCFYVVDLPSFSLHRWYTDNEFFRYFSSPLKRHMCVMCDMCVLTVSVLLPPG